MGNDVSIRLKQKNRNAIYNLIYDNSGLSKKELSFLSDISLPTVTQDLKELMDMDLIEEVGSLESTGGRKAKAFACIDNARTAIGIEITKNHLSMVIVDLRGSILDFSRVRRTFEQSDRYYGYMKDMLDELIAKNGIDHQRVLGIGISVPAMVKDDHRTIIETVAIEVTDSLYDELGDYLEFPYAFFRDARAGLMAELWKRKNSDNLAYLLLNYTVAGSVVISGRHYAGDTQRSCDMGHFTLVPGGKQCYCGKDGCVDSYCSARAIIESAGVSLDEFFRRLREHDNAFTKIWDDYLNYLAITVNNLRMIFDCDVIIGGEISRYFADYLDPLRERVKARHLFGRESDYVKLCSYIYEGPAKGAALYYIDMFISSV